MPSLELPYHRPLSKTWIALGCVLALLLILLAYIALLSYRHDESPQSVATKIARFTALTIIEYGVRIFEPENRYRFAISPNTPRDVVELSKLVPAATADFPDFDFNDIIHRADASSGQSLFHFGSFPQPQAAALRDYFRLDQFILDSKERFTREPPGLWPRAPGSDAVPDTYILAELTNFVSELWDHRVPGTSVDVNYEDFSTLRLAKRAKKGEAFYCQVFAMAVIEVSRALGYHGRLVSLSHEGVGYQHGVAEIWVPDLGKWVVFDADFNLFYGSPTEPLSATEVSETLSRKRELPVVHGRSAPNRPYASNRAFSVERSYNNIEWAFRNDFWSNKYFRGHPNKSDGNSLIWSGNSTRSNRLTYKSTTSDPRIANFSILSYAFKPVSFDRQTATLSGELAIHYPDARSVRLRHQSGKIVPLQIDSGSRRVELPIEPGENTYSIMIDTDGYSTVQRPFYITWAP